jgi:hypothetical protein
MLSKSLLKSRFQVEPREPASRTRAPGTPVSATKSRGGFTPGAASPLGTPAPCAPPVCTHPSKRSAVSASPDPAKASCEQSPRCGWVRVRVRVRPVRDVQRLRSAAEAYEEQIRRLEAQLLGARDVSPEVRVRVGAGEEEAERRHPTGREKMDAPTLQTIK